MTPRALLPQFNCAGRSIKQGLIAVDIVSHVRMLAMSPASPVHAALALLRRRAYTASRT